MSEDGPPDHIKDFHCVEFHEAVEQDDDTVTHHVEFGDDFDFMYGRLLDVIRACGYEVMAFGYDDDNVNADEERLWVVLVETDDTYSYNDFSFDDPPEWITDLPL